jgi:hypothetical protein
MRSFLLLDSIGRRNVGRGSLWGFSSEELRWGSAVFAVFPLMVWLGLVFPLAVFRAERHEESVDWRGLAERMGAVGGQMSLIYCVFHQLHGHMEEDGRDEAE